MELIEWILYIIGGFMLGRAIDYKRKEESRIEIFSSDGGIQLVAVILSVMLIHLNLM